MADGTTSDDRRDAVLALLKKGKTNREIVEAVDGVGTAFITKVAKAAVADGIIPPRSSGRPAKVQEPELEQEEQPEEQPEADTTGPEDGVVVSREYLETLEALRDQVLECARLRRALEARA